MVNNKCEKFIGVVGKVIDRINIVLKFKPSGYFKKNLFFTQKNCYAMDICAICNSSKKFIYVLARQSKFQYNAYIFAFINIYRNPKNYFLLGKYLLENFFI